jgi:hypothetical protein
MIQEVKIGKREKKQHFMKSSFKKGGDIHNRGAKNTQQTSAAIYIIFIRVSKVSWEVLLLLLLKGGRRKKPST